jgi:potassium efflux system protein
MNRPATHRPRLRKAIHPGLSLALALLLTWASHAAPQDGKPAEPPKPPAGSGSAPAAPPRTNGSAASPSATTSGPVNPGSSPGASPAPPAGGNTSATSPPAPAPGSAGTTPPASLPSTNAGAGDTIPTPDELAALASQAAAIKELSEEQRKQAGDLYRQAIEQLKARDAATARVKAREEDLKTLPERVATLKKKLDDILAEPRVRIAATDKLPELEAKLRELRAALDKAREESASWEQRGKGREREDAQTQLKSLRERHADTVKELGELRKNPALARDELLRARLMFLRCKRAAVDAEIRNAESILKSVEANLELVSLTRADRQREVRRLEKEVEAWDAALAPKRKAAAEEAASDVEQKSEDLAAALAPGQLEPGEEEKLTADEQSNRKARELALTEFRTIATRSVEMARRAQPYAAESAAARQEKSRITATHAGLTRKKQEIEKRITQASGATGLMLRSERARLPDLGDMRKSLRQRQEEIENTLAEKLELELFRDQLQDIDGLTDRLSGPAMTGGEDDKDLKQEFHGWIRRCHQTVDGLCQDREKYLSDLFDLDREETAASKTLEALDGLIAEQILWVKSTSVFGPGELRKVPASVAWLTDRTNWSELTGALVQHRDVELPMAGAFAILFGVLVIVRGRVRAAIARSGEQVSKPTNAVFGPTVKAFLWTLALSTIGTLPTWFLAWRLDVLAEVSGSGFVAALGRGATVAAVTNMLAMLAYEVCRNGGLADAHFGWQRVRIRKFRRLLRMLIVTLLPCLFLFVTLDASGNNEASDSLGRLAFIISHLAIAWFAHQALHYRTGLFPATSQDGFWPMARLTLYLIGVAEPLALAGVAAAGWYYTAIQLAARLEATFWLGGGLFLVNAMLVRWLLIARRRMALEQVRKRRLAKEQGTTDVDLPQAEETAVHLASVNAQTLRLVHSAVGFSFVFCLYLVWFDVLPALGVLDDVKLWTATQEVVEATGEGQAGKMVVREVPVTLFDALCGAVLMGLTVVAARNIPGLLEIALLQQLPLDSGGRYAATTVSRYLISIAGGATALGMFGLSWSSVQWLAAAMTVGLGFGLQEIFANFISGLILLFERPIRVGDVVSVGDTTGTVTRIRTRSTVIQDFDRRELVVPNKEFITGKIVNWTLSDPSTRVVLKLGVAYGTDPAEVIRTLKGVAARQTGIIQEPPPSALFDEFGEKAMMFSLRVVVPHVDQSLSVRHELCSAVNRAFSEAGIDFAYEQTDEVDVNIKGIAGSDRMAVTLAPGAERARVA